MQTLITLRIRTNYLNIEGEASVLLVLHAIDTKKVYQTGVYVKPEHWQVKTKTINHRAKNAFHNNQVLTNLINRANNFIFDQNYKKIEFSFQDLENYVFEKKPAIVEIKSDYYKFALDYIEFKKNIFSSEHIKGLNTEITKLKKFKETLCFEDINYNFLKDYEFYMNETLKNRINTIHKSFKRMKAIINEAIRQRIVKENPFSTYQVKTEKTNRAFLEISELKELQKLYLSPDLNDKLKNVLHYFLFACFTGLRFTDIQQLKKENIKQGFIELIIHKTGEYIRIPLSDPAAALLNPSGEISFNVLTNQKTNDYLKLIALQAKINKALTFHTARHSFATISILQGIPLEVISKLMGHNELKTTQIYARIVDLKKVSEMAKWNDF